MKLYWTNEGKNVIVLRDEKTAPRAHCGPRIDGNGYSVTILEPGMPGRGPFKFRTQAAQWAQDYISVRDMFDDPEFGPIPPEPARIATDQEVLDL